MRKVSSFFVIFFLTSLLFSNSGVGIQAGFDFSKDSDTFASATFRTDTNPWCISLNMHFTNPIFDDFGSTKTFTLNLDDWFVNERIAEHLDIFVLWGISFGGCYDSSSEKKDFSCGTGSRFGVGLDFLFFKRHLELFAQSVWNPYIALKRAEGDFGFDFKILNFPCAMGIRIWN